MFYELTEIFTGIIDDAEMGISQVMMNNS